MKELRMRLAQQAAVAELGQLALSGTDLTILLNKSASMASECLAVEYCKILELLPDNKTMLLRAGTGWKKGLVGSATISARPDTHAGYTLLFNEPVIVEDLSKETRFRLSPLFHDNDIVSGMSVIISDRTKPFGVLTVHTKRLRKFTNDDVHFLQSVANIIAMAIERKESEKQLKHRIVIETMLSDISSLFMSSPEIDLNNVLKILGESVVVNRSYIFECNKDGSKVSNTHEWCDEKTEPRIKNLQDIDVAMTPWWMSKLRVGENIIIPDLDALPSEAASEKEILKVQDIRSLVVVPICSRDGSLLGFMGFDDTEKKRSWSEDDVKVLRVVSDIVSYHFTHKKAEDSLRKSEARLSKAQKIAGLGCWERNLITNEVLCSDEAYNIFGLNTAEAVMTYETFFNAVHPEDRASLKNALKEALSKGKPYNHDYRILLPDGTERIVNAHAELNYDEKGNPVKLFGTILDITERRHLEEQLRHSQKMEAIGQFAGGIAHDFNNILTAIIGNAELLQMKMEEDSSLGAYVEHILLSSERAVNLTQSLLAFSRKQITNLKLVNLNEIVNKGDNLLQSLMGEGVELKTMLVFEDFSPAHPEANKLDGLFVKADSVQIEQILMNLVTNARDAMPDGGIIKIRTDIIELGEAFVNIHGYGTPGNYAVVSVEDTGMGMDEKTIEKIFEPFFTTKEIGKGTGLGLSIVYGIVKKHNGYVDVNSSPGVGTTFNIYLPLAVDERIPENVQ